MAYALPPNNLVHLIANDDGRARRLHDLDMELKAADWQTVDPGRGPVRGWGHGPRRSGR